MSLELFINSGSIAEIDLSTIEGARFEDVLSVGLTNCTELYFNSQDFSFPPITPPGVLTIPQVAEFMFDTNVLSDWDGSTPTKIRLNLKTLGRLIQGTLYQQRLFDIIQNSRVRSKIKLSSMDGLTYKEFEITEATYLERTYDDNGQKFYSLEWGQNTLTETGDFFGLFDYLPSSADRKDGFFTLIVTQIDTGINQSNPPENGSVFEICIQPSSKYGLLDVGEATFDNVSIENIDITSANIDSLTITGSLDLTGSLKVYGDIILQDDQSLQSVLDSVTNNLNTTQVELTKVITTTQYYKIPSWVDEVTLIAVGAGGGGGGGVNINEGNFTLGGSGGSGGNISQSKTFKFVARQKTEKNTRFMVYAQPAGRAKGGSASNGTLVVANNEDAYNQFSKSYNDWVSNNDEYGGHSPFFHGLNAGYAASLIIGPYLDKRYYTLNRNGYPIITAGQKALGKMWCGNNGEDGGLSYAMLLRDYSYEPEWKTFTEQQKEDRLRYDHISAHNNEIGVIALGGSGGLGGLSIAYNAPELVELAKLSSYGTSDLSEVNPNILKKSVDDGFASGILDLIEYNTFEKNQKEFNMDTPIPYVEGGVSPSPILTGWRKFAWSKDYVDLEPGTGIPGLGTDEFFDFTIYVGGTEIPLKGTTLIKRTMGEWLLQGGPGGYGVSEPLMPKSGRYKQRRESPFTEQRGFSIDTYLQSSTNAPQNLLTPTSFSQFHSDLFIVGRVKGRFVSEDLEANIASHAPKNVIYNDAVGVTGGAGGNGWVGFTPYTFQGTSELDKSERLAVKDTAYVTYWNAKRWDQITIGKGGIHRVDKMGDSKFQIGGNGGNATTRNGLSPTQPTSGPGGDIQTAFGAGGGGGASQGVIGGGSGTTTLNGGKKIPLSQLIDNEGNFITEEAQNGADGEAGVIIIIMRGTVSRLDVNDAQ